jgi:hypothetical protein
MVFKHCRDSLKTGLFDFPSPWWRVSQMQINLPWRTIGRSFLGLSILGLCSCPDARLTSEAASREPATIPVVQSKSTDTAIVDYPLQTVDYEICGELSDWQRLALAEQKVALANNPRYGAALSEAPLSDLFEKFWQESIITFTTYGLSARTEPIFLSGVWTGIEAMDACYEGDRPAAINEGELAEIWLIGHRIENIAWNGNEYEVTVEPTTTGLQFVQFERLESTPVLPVIVLEKDGSELTFASGDW